MNPVNRPAHRIASPNHRIGSAPKRSRHRQKSTKHVWGSTKHVWGSTKETRLVLGCDPERGKREKSREKRERKERGLTTVRKGPRCLMSKLPLRGGGGVALRHAHLRRQCHSIVSQHSHRTQSQHTFHSTQSQHTYRGGLPASSVCWICTVGTFTPAGSASKCADIRLQGVMKKKRLIALAPKPTGLNTR